MDHSILIRCLLLQWLGGIGFIVMAVAVLLFVIADSLTLMLFVFSIRDRQLKIWGDSQAKGFIAFLAVASSFLAI